MKVKIKHVDGVADVIAKVSFGNEICLDYRFQGIDYGRTLTTKQAVDLKIIECPHNDIQPILGFENEIVGEQCLTCGEIFK
jgi:hypothetical protein